MVWNFAQELPVEDPAGIHKMDFDVGGAGRFFQIKGGRGKAPQGVECAPLQQLGQRAFKRHLKPWVRPKAGKAALIFGMQQGHVHHGVLAAQRRVFHQNTKTSGTQSRNAGGNAWVALNHRLRHIGQTNTFADDFGFHMALKNLRQGLRARLKRGIARGHAVTHIQVANEVDGHVGGLAIALAHIGNGANATVHMARVEVHQVGAIDVALWVVKLVQRWVEQTLGPCAVVGQSKPTLLRVMHKRRIGGVGAQIEMRPKIVGGQALDKLTQGAGQTRHARGTFAVGKQHGAIAVMNVHRPNAVDGVQPTLFLNMKTQRLQLGL